VQFLHPLLGSGLYLLTKMGMLLGSTHSSLVFGSILCYCNSDRCFAHEGARAVLARSSAYGVVSGPLRQCDSRYRSACDQDSEVLVERLCLGASASATTLHVADGALYVDRNRIESCAYQGSAHDGVLREEYRCGIRTCWEAQPLGHVDQVRVRTGRTTCC
jgi:hypothetical protein